MKLVNAFTLHGSLLPEHLAGYTEAQKQELRACDTLIKLKALLGLPSETTSGSSSNSEASVSESSSTKPKSFQTPPTIEEDPTIYVPDPILEAGGFETPQYLTKTSIPSEFKICSLSAQDALARDVLLKTPSELAYSDFLWGACEEICKDISAPSLIKMSSKYPLTWFKEIYEKTIA